MTPAELAGDVWAFGPYCWVVGEVRLLPAPLPCRGMQGLWPVMDTAVSEALDAIVPPPGKAVGWVWWGLTLLQPYASAIAVGPKRVENRPWRRRVPAGGLWIGLHAGKALYSASSSPRRPEDDVEDTLNEWRQGPWPSAPTVAELPRGVMLGAMRIDTILAYPEGR